MDIKTFMVSPLPRWVALAAVVTTGTASAGITYFVTKKRALNLVEELVREEVRGTKLFLSETAEKRVSPVEAAKYVEDRVERELVETRREDYTKYQQLSEPYKTDVPEMKAPEGLTQVVRNVFTDMKDIEFSQEDIDARSPDRPYIITSDEFFESPLQTVSLTWYLGDEVLADEKDEHIPNIEKIIGEQNLLRFGYGSGDPNILYVRNDRMEVDFEITRSEGKYTEQVLGFVQHTDRVGVRKFRAHHD